MKEKDEQDAPDKERRDANTCMALGAGVGVLGSASAAITGAMCPLCIFVAPGLIGYGAYKRWKGLQIGQKGNSDENSKL